MQQFLRDLEDELAWIREKEPLTKSEEVGQNLIVAQNLVKKHDAFVAERTTHEQLIISVGATADQLVSRDHYAAEEIARRWKKLQEMWDELKKLSERRHRVLQDSLLAQQVWFAALCASPDYFRKLNFLFYRKGFIRSWWFTTKVLEKPSNTS